MKLLDYNGKVFNVMSRAGDLMLLNALLLICSLPIFTIGAAVSAVYDMSLRLIRGDEGYLIRGFFCSFKSNFRQSTQLWCVCVGVLLVSAGDLLVRRYLPQWSTLLTAAALIQEILLLTVMLYAFPLQARFENTLGKTMSNAVILALCSLPQTIMMLFISLTLPVLLLCVPLPAKLFPCVVTLCLLLGCSLVIYLNALVVSRIFEKHFHSEGLGQDEDDELTEEMLQTMYAPDGKEV